MAATLYDLILDQTITAGQAARRVIQSHTARWAAALDAANERYEYDREIAAAWAAYEAHENNGHVLPSELAWADGLNGWVCQEGEVLHVTVRFKQNAPGALAGQTETFTDAKEVHFNYPHFATDKLSGRVAIEGWTCGDGVETGCTYDLSWVADIKVVSGIEEGENA